MARYSRKPKVIYWSEPGPFTDIGKRRPFYLQRGKTYARKEEAEKKVNYLRGLGYLEARVATGNVEWVD